MPGAGDVPTSSWPTNDAELASEIDDASSIAWAAVMSRQGILLEHLRNLGSRGQPAATVVNAVDAIEIVCRHLMRSLVVAEDASRTSGHGCLADDVASRTRRR